MSSIIVPDPSDGNNVRGVRKPPSSRTAPIIAPDLITTTSSSGLDDDDNPANHSADCVDEREQLVNDCDCGAITNVSLAEAVITRLHGILLDFDPDRLHPDLAPSEVLKVPWMLWTRVVSPWLARHPVFARAEVRSSGRGLHVIVRMSPCVEFETDADRQKWAAAVKIVQHLLPTDPDCAGITALTRAIGSINSKNGAAVQLLQRGEPVHPDDVLALCQRAADRPFATVAGLLYSDSRISPCPICMDQGRRLDVLDSVGKCYGGCGKVGLGKLFDRFLTPRLAKRGSQ